MPELPEVETIRIGLQKYLIGKTISDVEIRLAKQFSGDPKEIIGGEITGVRRFGKGLVIDLDNSYSVAIHIKMTGQLIYRGSEVPIGTPVAKDQVGTIPNAHTHVIFKLQDSSSKHQDTAFLYYSDIRQFGWIVVVKTSEVSSLPFFKGLGPEPFKDLDLQKFQTILSKKRTAVKALLLDQKVIAGVGNIYDNDALYVARISPKRPANSLTLEESEALYNALLQVLKKGLETGGASEWQYVNVLGQSGGYQDHFQVYGQVGKKCKRDGTIIEKITLGGRGTFFCPECQV